MDEELVVPEEVEEDFSEDEDNLEEVEPEELDPSEADPEIEGTAGYPEDGE